jgi:hypothetical protein
VLTVAHVRGEFWVGYLIFGYIQDIYIHLGCFSALGEVGGSRRAFENGFQKSGLPN